MKEMIKAAIAIISFAISTSVWAFMPANGLWGIDSEMTGDTGRGFTIEVENEVLIFLYYGYRNDGSSLFYIASGPIVNNTFSADLLTVQGGTPIGAAYRPGVETPLLGKVVLNFTSGKHGTITLPSESPKAISKYGFGYADGPDGLLGTWLLTSTIGTSPFIARIELNTKLGTSSSKGNGVVTTSTHSYGCEFQVSGTLAGQVTCVNMLSSKTDGYFFKFSGDRGAGINIYGASGSERSYESHALRISTKTGVMTGLNDGTETSIQINAADVRPLSISSSTALDLMTMQAEQSAAASSTPSIDDPAKAAALAAWAAEVRAIVSAMQ